MTTPASKASEQRRAERLPVTMTGVARVAVRYSLIDASSLGVRATLSMPLPVGSIIKIGLPNEGSRHARVAWTDGDITGCEFLSPLTPTEFASLFNARSERG